MGRNLDAVRDAIAQAKVLAAEFHTGLANFYEEGNIVPVFVDVPVRVKKPKPSSFDAGNQTVWATKRELLLDIPLDLSPYGTPTVVSKGLIVQVSTPDGDPTINGINFVVQSSLNSQFAATRKVAVSSEIVPTPRIS